MPKQSLPQSKESLVHFSTLKEQITWNVLGIFLGTLKEQITWNDLGIFVGTLKEQITSYELGFFFLEQRCVCFFPKKLREHIHPHPICELLQGFSPIEIVCKLFTKHDIGLNSVEWASITCWSLWVCSLQIQIPVYNFTLSLGS
jgi:hypothetical protein